MKFFKWTSLVNGLLFIYLTLLLLFQPEAFLADLNLQSSATSLLILKRAAMFMLGVSIISFLASNSKDAQSRKAISLGFTAMLLGLSATGINALSTGIVSNSIITSIIIEAILGLCFLFCFIKNRNLK
jgi:hypothetical protein